MSRNALVKYSCFTHLKESIRLGEKYRIETKHVSFKRDIICLYEIGFVENEIGKISTVSPFPKSVSVATKVVLHRCYID